MSIKRTQEHKSQQQSKLYNMLMYNNVKMCKILRKHQPKISSRWATTNRSLL